MTISGKSDGAVIIDDLICDHKILSEEEIKIMSEMLAKSFDRLFREGPPRLALPSRSRMLAIGDDYEIDPEDFGIDEKEFFDIYPTFILDAAFKNKGMTA